MKQAIKLAAIAAILLVIFPGNAHAYLDPGAGSYLLQILAAFFFAGLFTVKGFWKNIKGFFIRFFRKGKQTSEKENRDKS